MLRLREEEEEEADRALLANMVSALIFIRLRNNDNNERKTYLILNSKFEFVV